MTDDTVQSKDTDKAGAADRPSDMTSDASGDTGREIDPKLLEILVCPVSRGPLTWDREAGELISEKARLAYPIRRGIPVMLEAEARRLDD